MNRAKLFGRIAEKGFNLTTLSKALKMPYQTLYRKINGETEFTVGEAEAVCEVLGIPLRERAIFFLNKKS
jgi:hypothetical protein|nr:MAG TPA: LAMBDA REPRESSOR (TRIPLE MUTANT)/DNA COMPLEX-DNA COMPLEX, DOUBLE HELIX, TRANSCRIPTION-DNA.1A [Caudoviricetes sp.]